MPSPDLDANLPYLFPTEEDSDFADWLEAHQQELERFDADLDDVQKSLQITRADDEALDRLGAGFGPLGRRRGRDDPSYRSYLLSLVGAFDGRGTPPGLRLAVAAGVLAEQEDVALIEDFDALEYELVLSEWSAHSSSTVRDLAELADPSVVQQRDPVHYLLGSVDVDLEVADTAVATMTTAEAASPRVTASTAIAEMLTVPTASIRVDVPGSTSTTLSTRGLSASDLEPLSQGSTWNLSET